MAEHGTKAGLPKSNSSRERKAAPERAAAAAIKPRRARRWPTAVFGILLAGFTAFTVLEAFVLPQTYATVDNQNVSAEAQSEITVTTYRKYDTDIYVADVQLGSADELRTAFAQDIYGKNITAPTSEIAESNSARLAINGDYYSARSGYVIRNGVIYSDYSASDDQEDLVIYEDGSMDVIREGETTAQELLDEGAMQVFCFGPALVEDGEIAVADGEEVSGKAMSSNPRTAIGWISDTHYVFIVSDGRTDDNAGLDLDELAEICQELGCSEAYNLDGGGSSTMYYNGNVINTPASHGRHSGERSVSDIVYVK